jgi:general secretion pathway protein G
MKVDFFMCPYFSKRAFTLIELIFVIVVIGILSAIAIPKFSGVEDQAVLASGRSTVASVRAAISSERQKRLMLGDSSYISQLDGIGDEGINDDGRKIFDNNGTAADSLLTYPIITKNASGGWMKTGTYTYTYNVDGTTTTFTYDPTNGTFDCVAGMDDCNKLTQ